jgi:hypothetical protein
MKTALVAGACLFALAGAAHADDMLLDSASCGGIGSSLSYEGEWLSTNGSPTSKDGLWRPEEDRSFHAREFSRLAGLWDQCLKLIDAGKVDPNVLTSTMGADP